MSLIDYIVAAGRGYAVGQLIAMDRTSAVRSLKELVEGITPQQLDDFEQSFLDASMGMLTPTQRKRSMELYAFLKVCETLHYGQWRGFAASTPDRALN
jgi:hypothetical protein